MALVGHNLTNITAEAEVTVPNGAVIMQVVSSDATDVLGVTHVSAGPLFPIPTGGIAVLPVNVVGVSSVFIDRISGAGGGTDLAFMFETGLLS